MIRALVTGLDPILLLKVTLLLAAGGTLAHRLRRGSSSTRHFVWASTLGATLLLALALPFAPRVPVTLPALPPGLASLAPAATPPAAPAVPLTTAVRDAAPAISSPTSDRAQVAPARAEATPATSPWRSPRSPGLALWLAGTVVVLGRFALGRLGLARIERRAQPLVGPEWTEALERAARALGVVRRVRLVRSAEVGAPVTWGVWRPVIALPLDAETWPESRRRDVLLHELAHVGRRDAASQLVALLACAAWWFHPLAWWAARRLRAEGERACDDRVLAAGSPAADYAALLLEVARSARSMRLAGAVSIGMARASSLEGRLLAVLDEHAPRRRATPRALLATTAAMATLAFAVALVTPVVGAPHAHAAGSRASDVTPATVAATGEADVAGTTTTLAADDGVNQSEHHAHPTVVSTGSTASGGSGESRGDGDSDAPVVAAGFDDARGVASEFERSVEAKPGGRLRVDLRTGAGVRLIGWDEPRVRVRGRLSGSDWREERYDVDRVGDGVRVVSSYAHSYGSHSSSDELEIQVPRHYDLVLASAGGSLSIRDVRGEFSGQTGGGEILLERVTGSAHLATGGGDIRVDDCELAGSVSTGGGMVKFSRVRGGLRGSSGSGPVIYDEPRDGSDATGDLSDVRVDDEGNVRHDSAEEDDRGDRGHRGVRGDRGGVTHISRAGGAVHLDEAPSGAVVSTGGGEVTIGRSAGRVKANTGGGDIDIGPVAGSVDAATGSGAVHVRIARAEGDQTVDVRSGTGQVVIELPDDFDGTLDLETSYTRSHGPTHIDLPGGWSVSRETTMEWDDRQGTPRRYVRANGTVGGGGGGGHVRVRTVNGDIVIRRVAR